ncbi:MAG: class III extradiol ring-cleavage dioxygenase [Polyangiales bacterium]|nr:dioxygenase [Myxococcales bacterium]
MPPSATPRMPVGFVAHGAPTLAMDAEKGAPLVRWSQSIPEARAILVVSAHWTDAPVRIGQTRGGVIMHDFGGFPAELYRMRYDAPGAPELATRVESLLGDFQVVRDERQPLDHGVWVPLVHLRPAADVPVLQVSMPRDLSPGRLVALGRALAPLRDEGVWILGSGNVVHNLRRIAPDGSAVPSWAEEMDAYVGEALARGDVDALASARERAPAYALAHPTDEHYRPLLVAAGAADGQRATIPFDGWEYGSISRRSVDWRS